GSRTKPRSLRSGRRFRVEKVTTPAGSKNKLVVDAGEADLVREVFEQYLSGSGAKATAIGLNRRGLLSKLAAKLLFGTAALAAAGIIARGRAP
ncbi:MAG TPA: recombinase family protein, partial [Polyangiaceae bacterium]